MSFMGHSTDNTGKDAGKANHPLTLGHKGSTTLTYDS